MTAQTRSNTYRRWLPTAGHVTLCAVLATAGSQRGQAFMLAPFLPFLLIWLPWSLWVVWRKPAKRRMQVVLVALWLITVAVVLGLAQWRAPRIRTAADAVVLAVDTHLKDHATAPDELTELGLDTAQLKADGIHYQTNPDDTRNPHVYYESPSNRFDLYVWNFDTREWDYQPD